MNVKNVLSSLLSVVFPAALFIAGTAIVVRFGATKTFAALSVVWLWGTIFSNLDAGLGRAFSKALANKIHKAKANWHYRFAVQSEIIWRFSNIGLLFVVLGGIGFGYLLLTDSSGSKKLEWNIVKSIEIIGMGAVTICCAVFRMQLEALGKFNFSTATAIAMAISLYVPPVAYVMVDTYENAAFASTLAVFSRAVTCYFIIYFFYRRRHTGRHKATSIRRLIKYCASSIRGFALYSVSCIAAGQGDRLFAAKALPHQSFAAYNAIAEFLQKLNILPLVLLRVATPTIDRLALQRDNKIYGFARKLILAHFFMAAGLLALYPLFSMWVRWWLRIDDVDVMRILLVSVGCSFITYPLSNLCVSNGGIRSLARAHIAITVAYFFSIVICYFYFSSMSAYMVASISLARAVVEMFYLVYLINFSLTVRYLYGLCGTYIVISSIFLWWTK